MAINFKHDIFCCLLFESALCLVFFWKNPKLSFSLYFRWVWSYQLLMDIFVTWEGWLKKWRVSWGTHLIRYFLIIRFTLPRHICCIQDQFLYEGWVGKKIVFFEVVKCITGSLVARTFQTKMQCTLSRQ